MSVLAKGSGQFNSPPQSLCCRPCREGLRLAGRIQSKKKFINDAAEILLKMNWYEIMISS